MFPCYRRHVIGAQNLRSTALLAMAIAVATATACAVAFIFSFVFVLVTWPAGADGGLFSACLVGAIAAYFALVACPIFVFIGLPLYAFSRRRGWLSAPVYVAVGATVSCIGALVAWLLLEFSNIRGLVVAITIFGGTSATLAFWWVLRPDRYSGN